MTIVSGMATKKQTPAKKKAAPKAKPKATPKKKAVKVSSKTTSSVKKPQFASVADVAKVIEEKVSVAEVKEVAATLQKTSLGKRFMNWLKGQAAK